MFGPTDTCNTNHNANNIGLYFILKSLTCIYWGNSSASLSAYHILATPILDFSTPPPNLGFLYWMPLPWIFKLDAPTLDFALDATNLDFSTAPLLPLISGLDAYLRFLWPTGLSKESLLIGVDLHSKSKTKIETCIY